ncbi:type II secretion system minor pseudopilin GspK [Lysobacter sp. GX 14042]|uniref:type II secretion system minor pseudopilin GspK n=1 Tax=Lysobacter sp. GX 14042 TaxID=2907155 RepID=UPI001F2A3129|nr:type II secretion system minor pseudopilin GspK [Lysobacter sp. GX 14042]MCE7033201.1 type II secretion system minor pseudopilin GspK [Lysobacter sp. GX 14042]
MNRRRQDGVALLTVLLLAAVMSALLVVLLDDIRFGVRRSGNTRAMEQARWHALSAETLARGRIATARLADVPGGAGQYLGQPLVFPLEAGAVRVRIHDAGNCFNLNSVVEGAPEQWRRSAAGAAEFTVLLETLGFGPARAGALGDALVDWIDSDPVASPAGAEDIAYTLRRPGYRTAGHLLAEPSELRAITGFDPTAYQRLRPYVCALPVAAPARLNADTLIEHDAPVLVALTGGALPLAAARELLRQPPAGGWQDREAFWTRPALARLALPDAVRDRISLHTSWYGLNVEVEHAGAQLVMTALLEDQGGTARLVARRWTHEE